MTLSIQGTNFWMLVYTPGRCSLPQPIPQDTNPIRTLCPSIVVVNGPPESPWQLSLPPSLKPAHRNTSCIVSRRPAARNQRWHRSLDITSTSTSCSTVGTVDTPWRVLPQPATVAVLPTSFTLVSGKHTGMMCGLKTTVLSSFTRATSLRKSVGLYWGCTFLYFST